MNESIYSLLLDGNPVNNTISQPFINGHAYAKESQVNRFMKSTKNAKNYKKHKTQKKRKY